MTSRSRLDHLQNLGPPALRRGSIWCPVIDLLLCASLPSQWSCWRCWSRHCTALFDASLHLKAGFAVAYSACEFVVEALDDVDNLLWHPIGLKDAPQTLSVHAVKSLLKVYKVDAKLSLPLCALLCDVRKVKICSVHLFPFWDPACSLLNCWSTVSAIRWMMILARILLGTDSKVIPRQLLQFLRAPFLGIFTMTPSVQSLGNFFPSQMSVKSGWSRSAASCGCPLNTSALRLSCPGDFPFLRDLTAAMISSFPGGLVLTSRSVSASCISASLGGGGLFRTSLKCSVHRVPC